MDGRTEGWAGLGGEGWHGMDGWMDARMHGCVDAWMDGCADAWMYGCMVHGRMDVYIPHHEPVSRKQSMLTSWGCARYGAWRL